ncbi:hypothetical protein BST61_g2211 [Cercospora zeina]
MDSVKEPSRNHSAAFVISPLQPEDAPGLARTMMTAFYQDPLWVALWSETMSLQGIISDCAARLPWNMVKTANSGKRFQKAIESSTGQIVGYARWNLPASKTSNDVWQEALPPAVGQVQRDAFEERFRCVTEDGQIRGLNRGMEADIKLEYLAVHPDYQRNGVGRLLLREGLAIADRLGLKTFVIARDAGVKLYLTHDFREVDKVTQPRPVYGWNRPHVTTFLIRAAAGTKR